MSRQKLHPLHRTCAGLLGLLLFAGGMACGTDERVDDGVHRGNSATSDNGDFKVSFATEPSAIRRGSNAFEITLRDGADQPVTGAALKLQPYMPSHGHGSPTEAVVTESGEGVYRAADVVFDMPGLWWVTFHIRKGEAHDHAKFAFDIP